MILPACFVQGQFNTCHGLFRTFRIRSTRVICVGRSVPTKFTAPTTCTTEDHFPIRNIYITRSYCVAISLSLSLSLFVSLCLSLSKKMWSHSHREVLSSDPSPQSSTPSHTLKWYEHFPLSHRNLKNKDAYQRRCHTAIKSSMIPTTNVSASF